jgi:hypothetical protein
MQSSQTLLKAFIKEVVTEIRVEWDLEEELAQIIDEPEYMSPDTFVEWAHMNDVSVFGTVALQAIARNVAGVPAPGQETIRDVKQKLIDAGLTYEPRGIVSRGVRTDKHSRGTLRYDGWAAGTGLFRGLPGIGRGQGAIGGSNKYHAEEPGALPMSSKRR